jgi:PiT family inorganic phosphate transporter
LWGTAVAKTIASGLVDTSIVSTEVVICALSGAIIWNLITWYFGMPSSSSHALIGGLCGAALATAHNDPNVIIWSVPSATHWWEGKGILWKVIVPMLTSPLCGFVLGFAVMVALYLALLKVRPRTVNSIFGKAQIISAASMGFMHGTNDAQKTMGIIALSLVGATQAGVLDNTPSWLNFLHLDPGKGGLEIPNWIKIVCAITMAAGTAAGGWKIIKTLGHKMVKLQPIHGFAAETSSSAVIWLATHFGIPVSTTHNISAAIMGVGSAKSFNALRWHVVEQMLWAWVLTIPAAGGFAYFAATLLR